MIKKIVEFPFVFAGWLFKDTYGRLCAILMLALLVCLIDYPVTDTEIGVWEVEYTLKEQFSREEGDPSFVDSASRIDPSAIASRRDVERLELRNAWALATSPFHHRAERLTKLIWAVIPKAAEANVDPAVIAEKAPCAVFSKGSVVLVVNKTDAPLEDVVAELVSAPAKKPVRYEIGQIGPGETKRISSFDWSWQMKSGQRVRLNAKGQEPIVFGSSRWNEERTRKIVRMEVLRISRGLVLGLDLKGGTELTLRIVAPEGAGDKLAIHANEMAQIIRERIDNSGQKEPRVQVVGDDRILIQIPGVDASDVARIRSIITRTGRLEFRLVADPVINKVQLDLAKAGKMPDKWHYYWLEKEDPENPGKMLEPTKLLISDRLDKGQGLTGDSIEYANVGQSSTKITVNVKFKDSNVFWQLTKDNVNRQLAIITDDVRDEAGILIKTGKIHSAPNINEPIMGGAEISGDFTRETAEQLKLTLQSGSLKWPLELESEQFVGPYQGLQSIQEGRQAIIIGFIAVVAFILIYYLKAGLVANFALLLNLLILVAALALKSATLTLPGIAGIMLTIGMSIDANVLIFERIREEIKKMADKPLLKCMRDGHSKALVTIFDANLTTLITGLILHEFGTGPIKGFAVTLCYGIVISMFTAIVVTRVIFEALVKLKMLKTLPMLEIVKSANIPFIAMRKLWLVASGALVIGGLAYFAVGPGERFGIEFQSGTRVEVNLNKRVTAETVRGKLKAAGYENVQVQEISQGVVVEQAGSSSFSIRLPHVPIFNVVEFGPADSAKHPDFAGGAEVVVQSDRPADEEVTLDRLTDLGSPDCVVEEGPKAGGLFTYTIRSKDKRSGNVSYLTANVQSVFGSELTIGGIRGAFRNEDGTSLLADRGVRKTSDTTVRIALKKPATPAEIKKAIAGVVGDVKPEGELVDGKTSVVLVATANASDAMPKIKEALRSQKIATLEPFAGVTKIYPSVAQELTIRAIIAMGLALLAIVAYVWFRFEFRFGLAAVIALVHDVSITLAVLALCQIEISLTVIAALLTIIGYSLNDTIVVFDRVRENRRTVRKTKFPEIVNLSINQTLSRTILTSFTTLLAVLALYFLGGAAIRPFAVTLLVGVVAGTYSSIVIASPVLLMTGEQGATRGPLGSVSSKTVRPLEGFRERG